MCVKYIITQTCAQCGPQLKPGYGAVPVFTVLIDSGFDATDLNAITYGINLWNNWFTSHGQPAMFKIVSYGPAQINVGIDPSLTGGPAAQNTNTPSGAQIVFNPDYLGRGLQGLLINEAAHEFGHSVGFGDVRGSSCTSSTVMSSPINVNGPYNVSLKTCDRLALGQNFPSPSASKSGMGPR